MAAGTLFRGCCAMHHLHTSGAFRSVGCNLCSQPSWSCTCATVASPVFLEMVRCIVAFIEVSRQKLKLLRSHGVASTARAQPGRERAIVVV